MLAGMPGPIRLLAAAAVLGGATLSMTTTGSAAPAGGAAGTPCGPPAAQTLAADAVARVYVSGGAADGCATGGTRSYRLGTTGTFSRSARVTIVRVAGRIAAYGLETSGVDVAAATVNVRRLTTGRLLARRPATTRTGVEGFQSVDSVVLKADGAVAWIATARSIGTPRFIRQLSRLDRRGFRILDSGPGVVAASLTLHGSTLSWRHRTAARSAPLR